MAEIGTYQRAEAPRPLRRRAPARHGGDRHAPGPAAARPLAGARAGPRARGESRGGRAEPALPQPPRLCAADPVPPLRLPLPMPELHRLDGRAPLHPPARLPPLRPCHAGARAPARNARRRTASSPAAPASSGSPTRSHALLPEARTAIVTSDTIWSPAKAAEFVARMEARRDRHRHRHPARHQGLSFPQPHSGRRGRRRSRPRRRRPARRRAQLPADPPGLRPRRPRREARPRPRPDPRSVGAGDPARWSSGDADGFYAAETDARREAAMPPFGRLAAIIVSSEDQAEATEAARMIGRAAPRHDNMAVLGPAPAPLAMLRGRHRLRLLVHAARAVPVQEIIRDWLGGAELAARRARRGRRRSLLFPLIFLCVRGARANSGELIRGATFSWALVLLLAGGAAVRDAGPGRVAARRFDPFHRLFGGVGGAAARDRRAARALRRHCSGASIRSRRPRDAGSPHRLHAAQRRSRSPLWSGRTVAGLYKPDAAGPFMIAPREDLAQTFTSDMILFHEYAHHFMLQNYSTVYPPWYVEGFAELLSTTRFERDGSIKVGAFAAHRAYELAPMPVRTLLFTRPPEPARGGSGGLLCQCLVLHPLSDPVGSPDRPARPLHRARRRGSARRGGRRGGLRRSRCASARLRPVSPRPDDPRAHHPLQPGGIGRADRDRGGSAPARKACSGTRSVIARESRPTRLRASRAGFAPAPRRRPTIPPRFACSPTSNSSPGIMRPRPAPPRLCSRSVPRIRAACCAGA